MDKGCEMKNKLKAIIVLLKKAIQKYKTDDPVKLAGTTAYFTVFAMAPIIIIIISAVGILMGKEEIQEKVFIELNQLVGEQGTQYVRDLVSNYQDTQKSIIGTIVGFVIFIFTSTTFFKVMQSSLNFIWRIRVKSSHGFLRSLKDRLLSFGLILSLGFIMLVSLLIDAGVSYLRDYLEKLLPNLTVLLIDIGNYVLSIGVVTLVFAMIYKFLPDARIKWKVTWIGAIITTILFMAGKSLIGIALGASNIGVMYGAAGSLVVILMWVFYSSIIFFFGAEITQQYAEMYAHNIVPKDYAVKIEINEVNSKQ